MPIPEQVRFLVATAVLIVGSLACAQGHVVRKGESCAECAPDEIAVTVRGEARGARNVQWIPPCAQSPSVALEAAAARGDLTEPAFALRVPGDARPMWFRDFLVSLDADPQHLLAGLLNGFTSECLVLGVRLDEGSELRGYELAAASGVTSERPCQPDGGRCGLHATGFSTTPTELELAGARWLVAVFRNYGNPGDFDGADRVGVLTVYLGPVTP